MASPLLFVGGIGGPEVVLIFLVFSLPIALLMLAAIVHAAREQEDATPTASFERDPSTSSDRALEELRIAYARGVLDDEEFERRRRILERNRGTDDVDGEYSDQAG